MSRPNIILMTDSYKLTHPSMLLPGTTRVESYLEARPGGAYDRVLWNGLQGILMDYLEGPVVTHADIEEAVELQKWHFSPHHQIDSDWIRGWERIVNVHGGRLPLRIRAAREGLIIPTDNVLMTYGNTDPLVPWLTGAVESILLKVWYPTTVGTVSWHLRRALELLMRECGGDSAQYLLHDFGYRGASSEESAAIGGLAHLFSFMGTDTIPAMLRAQRIYGASLDGLAHSVVASEHQVMTAGGIEGEIALARNIITMHQNQIVSLVADSFDYKRFVAAMIKERELVDRCHVRLVIRPDSLVGELDTPSKVVLWTLNEYKAKLPVQTSRTGHAITHYGALWGDGIDPKGVLDIATAAVAQKFSLANLVFGMGGGLLQKVNRDTCRFAIKSSAQERDGQWISVKKDTPSKRSKGGRLALYKDDGGYRTGQAGDWYADQLETVFEDGVMTRRQVFKDIRSAAVAAALAP